VRPRTLRALTPHTESNRVIPVVVQHTRRHRELHLVAHPLHKPAVLVPADEELRPQLRAGGCGEGEGDVRIVCFGDGERDDGAVETHSSAV